MKKIVFVTSIPRVSVFGIDQWKTENNKPINKTKIGQSADYITAIYSSKVGGLANYISYNYYIDPETGKPFLDEKGNKVTLQTYLEQKWNKPEGYFNNLMQAPNTAPKDENLTYFQRMSWRLNDGSTMFDLSTMDGELGYYVLLASPYVANSEKEWREHKWPRATHYIALENESDEIKFKRTRQKGQSIAKLTTLTDTQRRQVVTILKLASWQSTVSLEQAYNLIFEYLDANVSSNLEKFTELVSLLDTVEGREQFEARHLLQACLDQDIIREKQGTYTWRKEDGPIVIGERYSQAIEYITNPRKAEDVETLRQQLERKVK